MLREYGACDAAAGLFGGDGHAISHVLVDAALLADAQVMAVAVQLRAGLGRQSVAVTGATDREQAAAHGQHGAGTGDHGPDGRALEGRSRREGCRVILDDPQVMGAYTREAAREFARRGVVPELSCAAGKVICMSSVHEVIPWAGHVNYAASKGGVMMFMQSVAQELAHLKIRVNGIAPGAIRTPINRSAWESPAAEAELLKLIPYERIGEPADIASAVLFLVEKATYVTGQVLNCDGGMVMAR